MSNGVQVRFRRIGLTDWMSWPFCATMRLAIETVAVGMADRGGWTELDL